MLIFRTRRILKAAVGVLTTSVIFIAVTPARAVTMRGQITVYEPGEINCNQSYSDQEAVQVNESGLLQPVIFYCRQLAAASAPENISRQPLSWGFPYQVEAFICRERSGGAEMVCLMPESAANLRWEF